MARKADRGEKLRHLAHSTTYRNSRNPHQFVGLASHFNAAFEAAIDHGGLYKWDRIRERTVVFVFERCVERIQEPAEKFRCIATLLHGELFVAAARYFV